MTVSKPLSLNVNNLDLDYDGKNDRITFQVTQTEDHSFQVKTCVDMSKNGFGALDSDTTKKFKMDTPPNWQLSSLKFENDKLLLVGQDGTYKDIAFSQLPVNYSDSIIILGALDASLIDKVIREHQAQIQYYYEKILQKYPGLNGTVTITFVISGDGSVSKAEVKSSKWSNPMAGKEVEDALCVHIPHIFFPSPKGGGTVTVNYPFNFSPSTDYPQSWYSQE